MSLADTLLRSLSDSQTDSDDKTLVIDNYFRTITIPKSITNLGVQYDDDVLVLDFRMPRYLGDTDLSAFTIRINYMNARGEKDAYTVKDAVVGSSHITFSWLVGPTATAYKGNTSFNVCLKTLTSDNYVDRAFHTSIATLPVLEGLEADEHIVSTYSDILEQWRQELFGIGDTEEATIRAVSTEEQENIAQKGVEVLATIPEDYATTFGMINHADRTKADAILCSSEGDAISVVDASDDHVRNLRIFGKTTQLKTTGAQLIPQPYADGNATINGVRFTVNADGSVAASGTSTAGINYYFARGMTLPAGTYTFSKTGDLIGGSLCIYDFTALISIATLTEDADSVTFTTDVEYTSIGIYINTAYEGKVFGGMVYPMLNKGSTTLPYEQYTGAVASPNPEYPQDLVAANNPKTIICGKNLWNPEKDYDSSGTYWSWKVKHSNEKMTITLIDKNTSVDLSGCYFGVTGVGAEPTSGYRWLVSKGNVYLTTHTTEYNYISVYPNDADTLDKLSRRFYIMVELGEEFTSYEDPRDEMTMTVNRVLNGIPVVSDGNYTDSNGQQWICDEIDFERGVYVQRTQTVTFNGTENWYISAAQYSSGTRFDVNISGVPQALLQDVLCDRFVFKGANAGVETTWVLADTAGFRIITEIASTVDELIQFLTDNPTTVIYTLKEPIETVLTAEEIEAFKALCTNFPNTTVLNDAGAWMKLKYNADTKTYLDRLPKATDEQVWAAVDRWLTAKYGAIAEEASF